MTVFRVRSSPPKAFYLDATRGGSGLLFGNQSFSRLHRLVRIRDPNSRIVIPLPTKPALTAITRALNPISDDQSPQSNQEEDDGDGEDSQSPSLEQDAGDDEPLLLGDDGDDDSDDSDGSDDDDDDGQKIPAKPSANIPQSPTREFVPVMKPQLEKGIIASGTESYFGVCLGVSRRDVRRGGNFVGPRFISCRMGKWDGLMNGWW